jgi:cytochrome b561
MNGAALKRWPGWVRLFHWLSALMILTMMVAGLIMVRVTDIGTRFELYQFHKALGIIVLIFSSLRLFTRLILVRHSPVSESSKLQNIAASTVHSLLYVLIFSVVLTGWIMVSASPIPIPISLFGYFDVPSITPRDFETFVRAKTWHGWMTKILLVFTALHIAAALKHHFIDRDNVLRRMLHR